MVIFFKPNLFYAPDYQTLQCSADLEATLSHFFSPGEVPKAVPIMRKKYEEIYLDKTHFLDVAREVLETFILKEFI